MLGIISAPGFDPITSPVVSLALTTFAGLNFQLEHSVGTKQVEWA